MYTQVNSNLNIKVLRDGIGLAYLSANGCNNEGIMLHVAGRRGLFSVTCFGNCKKPLRLKCKGLGSNLLVEDIELSWWLKLQKN